MGQIGSFQRVVEDSAKPFGDSFLWVIFVLLYNASSGYAKVSGSDETHAICSLAIIYKSQGSSVGTPGYYNISSSVKRNHKVFLPDDGSALCGFPSKGQIFCFSIYRNHTTSKRHITLPESHIQPWLWNVLFVRGP